MFSSCLLTHQYLFPLSQHVTAEGMALVKHAEDAASNKKVCFYNLLFQVEMFIYKVNN
jgi:hypothetical protein